MALAPILMALLVINPGDYIPIHEMFSNGTLQISYFLVTFIPFAYVCRGKLGLLFKKPRLKDLKIIIICVILYLVFTVSVNLIGKSLGFQIAQNQIASSTLSILDVVFILIQLMAEDFFKVSILLIAMGLIYYFTKNRKNSLIFGTFVSMMIFGLTHLNSYDYNLFQCVVTIGIGTIFHLYPYLKTKNFANTYFTHIIIDVGILTFVNIAMNFLPH